MDSLMCHTAGMRSSSFARPGMTVEQITSYSPPPPPAAPASVRSSPVAPTSSAWLAPLRDLLGQRQARVEEQRLVAVPEKFWKFRREPGREQAVEHRGQHDEQHHAPAMSWRSREKRPNSTKQVWTSSPSMRGPAFGVPHEATIETIRLAGQFEALPLDPVYSGKGLAGLIALIRQGRWRNDEDVIFPAHGRRAGAFRLPECARHLSGRAESSPEDGRLQVRILLTCAEL